MDSDFEKAQGHWVLAQIGKKVLRPGGKELTKKLVALLDIKGNDDVIEFAPGLGYTTGIALTHSPKSYIGIDADAEVVTLLKQKFSGRACSFRNENAANTSLPSNSATKVFGEAMLTMHADHRKAGIIQEAYRILKPGGRYAIHELGLAPDSIGTELKAVIQRDLAESIRVNARPLTQTEWTNLLTNEGFIVENVATNTMRLLDFTRLIQDEGLWRTAMMCLNILRKADARRRVTNMRSVFQKHAKHMNAIVVVCRKPS